MTTIAEAVIQVAVANVEKAKKDLDSLKQRFGDDAKAIQTEAKKIQDALSFSNVTSKAAGAFESLVGTIKSFVAVASPLAFANLDVELKILSLHIGVLFLPLVKTAIEYIQQFTAWIKSLTKEQRESIIWWTKIVIAITGIGFGISKLLSFWRLLSAAMSPSLVIIALLAVALGDDLIPVLKFLGGILNWVVGLFKDLGDMLGETASGIVKWVAVVGLSILVASRWITSIGGIKAALSGLAATMRSIPTLLALTTTLTIIRNLNSSEEERDQEKRLVAHLERRNKGKASAEDVEQYEEMQKQHKERKETFDKYAEKLGLPVNKKKETAVEEAEVIQAQAQQDKARADAEYNKKNDEANSLTNRINERLTSGLFGHTNSADAMEKARQEAEEANHRLITATQGLEAAKKGKPLTGEKEQGGAAILNTRPQLMGLTEAWSRAQQANQLDPYVKLGQEQLEVQKKLLEEFRKPPLKPSQPASSS